MKTYSDETQARIESVAREREMTVEQVATALENYNDRMSGFFGPILNPAPYQVDLAITSADANDPQIAVLSAELILQRIAATYWAEAANVHIPDALRFFDAMPKWDAKAFAERFPITLPTTPDGMIDAQALTNSIYEGSLQRALMFDTQAAIAHASTWGGDDNWFDYLPNGIMQLQSLQSEDWVNAWVDIWNTHPYGIVDDQNLSDEEEEDNADYEETLAEKYGFFIQDVTSNFHFSLFRTR